MVGQFRRAVVLSMGVAISLSLVAGHAHAQPRYTGTTDTRTRTPDSVAGGREQYGLDIGLNFSLARGNVEWRAFGGAISTFVDLGGSSLITDSSFHFAKAGTATFQNDGSATVRWDVPIIGPLSLFAFSTHAYNQPVQLDYRTNSGAGPWLSTVTEKVVNGLSFAVVGEWEYWNGAENQQAARLSLRNLTRINLQPHLTMIIDAFVVPRADKFEDTRVYASASLQTKLISDILVSNISAVFEHDTRPLDGVKRSDFALTLGIAMRMGH